MVDLRVDLHLEARESRRWPVNWLAELVLARRPLICLEFAYEHVCSNALVPCREFENMLAPIATIFAIGRVTR